MSNLPGVGIFGCNEKSEFLISCLKQNGFEIKAIWSNNLEQAKEFSERLNIDFYTNEIDVLLLRKDIEFILIFCLQDNFVQIVSKAFTIGKHVLCDLPSNLSSKEINEMCQAASYYPSLISIFSFPLRYLPQFKIMRNLILDQNFIGEVNLINVSINGRNLIELDNFKKLLTNKPNCNVCNLIEKFEDFKSNEYDKSFIDEISLNLKNIKINNKYDKNLNNDEEMNKKNLIKSENKIHFSNMSQMNNNKNQNYIDSMKNGGLLNNLGPHVIDIITYLTDLKAKKVNGILRTFNSSAFMNELSLIKRITVDDFCTFQMEMYKPTIKINNQNDRDQNVDKNLDQNEQKKINEKNQKYLTINKKVKELSNNKPIALINLNDHLKIKDKSYEFLIGGEFGYLRLKDGNLFTYQYEQNNNQLINDKFDSNIIEEKLIYSIKDEIEKKLCILHQDIESSKLLMFNQNKKQFEVGLEKLVESIKNAFSNEHNLKTKIYKQLNEDLNKEKTKIENLEKKMCKDSKKTIEELSNNESIINGEVKLVNGNSKLINEEQNIASEETKINSRELANENLKILIQNKNSMNGDFQKKVNSELNNDSKLIETQKTNEQSLSNGESKLNGESKINGECKTNGELKSNGESKIDGELKLNGECKIKEEYLINRESKIKEETKINEETIINKEFKLNQQNLKINSNNENLVDNFNNNLLEVNLNKNENLNKTCSQIKNKENINDEYFKDAKNKINDRFNKCIILPLKEKISQVNSDSFKNNANKNEKINFKSNLIVSNVQNLNDKNINEIDLKLNNNIIDKKILKENNQNLVEQKLNKTTIDIKSNTNFINQNLKENNLQIKKENQNLDKNKLSTKVWFKEAVSLAGNFEDGKYVQNVIEAIRSSSKNYEWTRVFHNLVTKKNQLN